MELKNILFSIILLHAFTATFNESSVSSFEQTQEPNDDESSTQISDELGSGSPESSVSSFEKTHKPNDSNKSSVQIYKVLVHNIHSLYTGYLTREYFQTERVSIPHQHAEKYNESTYVLDKFRISDESVNFLKGLLVTRIMPSFYIIIILVSLPLNALALVTFTCKIGEKKPAVIYMSHLACVDLLFTLLLPLKIHYQMNASDWVFGEVMCRVLTAAYYCYMYCSILLMMCMSVDRLLAVLFPIASLTWRSSRKATCVCVLVWLLALAGTVPLLLVRQTFSTENVGITCHDVLYHIQVYAYLFSILSCIYFFLPLVVTLVSYATIIYVLSVKSDHLATSSSSSDSRRRAVIMTICVLTEFVACFAPTNAILLYHCVHLATENYSGEENSSYTAYLLAVCVGSSSVFLDPLLYYYGSSHYRKKFWSVLRYRKTKRAVKI